MKKETLIPKGLSALLVVSALLSPARPAFADTTPGAPLCNAAESGDYLTKASGQLLRGVTNLCFCWVELFNQPVVAHRKGRNVIGGLFYGVGHTLLRGAQGLGELFLFLDPKSSEDGTYPTTAHDCALGVIGLEER